MHLMRFNIEFPQEHFDIKMSFKLASSHGRKHICSKFPWQRKLTVHLFSIFAGVMKNQLLVFKIYETN